MSISTQRGDNGTTGLIGGDRITKSHLRIETLGCLDELNAALGLARSLSQDKEASDRIKTIQQELFTIGTTLATPAPPQSSSIQEKVTRLTQQIQQLEHTEGLTLNWSIPGEHPVAAALDLARTICRRTERWTVRLQENGETIDIHLVPYFNRLSDWLWLIARWVELRCPETKFLEET